MDSENPSFTSFESSMGSIEPGNPPPPSTPKEEGSPVDSAAPQEGEASLEDKGEQEEVEQKKVKGKSKAEKKKTRPTPPRSDKPKVSKSKRAGIVFPVGRVDRNFRKAYLGKRFSAAAPVYLASVLEYLTAEVLGLAGDATRDQKKKLIKPRYLMLALQNDEELNNLCKNAIIPEAGVLPHLHKFLLPVQKKSKKSKPAPANE